MPDVIDRVSVFRQRRLLLAITFALCAFHYLKAAPADQFSIAAITFNYTASRVEIGVMLWLVWLWAILRYFQYERAFRNDALIRHCEHVMTNVLVEATTTALQKAVREGKYESRGVLRDQLVKVSISPEGTLLPQADGDRWTLPTLTVRVFKHEGNWSWLDGGANCSFDPAETRALRRKVEQKLFVEYPHFTDFKVPYGLATLALLAGVIELARSLC